MNTKIIRPLAQPLFWGVCAYIVAPGEDRAPLCRDARPRVAVDARPRLIDVARDNGGTV